MACHCAMVSDHAGCQIWLLMMLADSDNRMPYRLPCLYHVSLAPPATAARQNAGTLQGQLVVCTSAVV
jgi:hypothetical protein